jgi:heme exporter protein C
MTEWLHKIEPWLGGLALILLGIGAAWGLWWAPADLYQGEIQRIMYVHVPSAWMAMLGFAVLFICSILYLWRRHAAFDTAAHASAGVGAVFTFLALVSGSIWGKPTWGTYWTWDARLTSTALLFILYIGYLMLRAFVDDEGKRTRFAAVYGIVAFLDVPIIHFSVHWWRTLHQPSSLLRPEGPAIAPEILLPLLWMGLAFGALYLYMMAVRMQLLRRERQLLIRREVLLHEQ